jgi:uncharacterized protein YutE (UPF0331/DUF86 family)
MTDDIRAVLHANLEGMRKSVSWLKRSHTKCSRIGVKEHYTEDEFDAFENLASRFARMLDVILNKVFRSIDAVELEDGGSLLDVVHRAEKRGIVVSAERIRDLKDLRNDIVHEYETDDLQSLFQQTLDATPELFGIAEEIERYCKRFVEP